MSKEVNAGGRFYIFLDSDVLHLPVQMGTERDTCVSFHFLERNSSI